MSVRDKQNKVVITGMGILAPNGKTIDDFWNANIQGRSGIGQLTHFDSTPLKVHIAGEVKDFDPEQYMLPGVYRKIDRFAQLGTAAANLAIEDAKITFKNSTSERTGIIIGSGLGGILFHEEQIITAYEKKFDWVASSAVPRISPNSVSSYIAMTFQIKGPNFTTSTACSSGANAIGQALYMLRSGIIDACVAGGVEAPITPVTFAAYQNLRAISRRNSVPAKASRPFDKERDGFVLSEGAGILILETEEHAKKRGAKIYAELLGFATNCGAYNMVAPQPDGVDAAHAMRSALKDAGIEPEDIDYINAHGTSTSFNDLAETRAIKEVFGGRAYKIPISSTKSMVGHSIGASGGIEAIVSVLVISKKIIPPTINLENPDPECDLDYVPNESRKTEVKTVMSNSFGFGSNNAVLIISRYGRGG